MKKTALLLVFLLMSAMGFATHNRAGEILYKRIPPLTQVVGGVIVPVFNYSITIYTYTDHGPNVADRCADTVLFGDGTRGIAPRINDGVANCGQGCIHCGQIMISDPNFTVKLNTYTITHTYSGAGSYLIRMLDPNRNAGVHNIPNSDQQPFYLESLLIINNFSGANSSPEFHNPPTDRACVGKCFYHDPAAYDVDGDSLSFEITDSRGQNGQTVPGYFPPETGNGGVYSINAVTGKLTWCKPQFRDEYNIAFIVKEWRKNTSGVYQMIGYVLRDMQVIVDACPLNNPPEVAVPPDTCVEAGTLIQKNLYITDLLDPLFPNPNNKVTLSGAGGAFNALSPVATLFNTFDNTPYISKFTWQTTCNHVRTQPYLTTFKVEDQGPDQNLVNFSTYSIRVVPPSVKNVLATPMGSTMKITWNGVSCNPSGNPLVAYKVYRKNDCTPLTYSPCATGIDPASGFSLIAQTATQVTQFVDNNSGNGLVVGQNYSYIVVALYTDGSQSFASSQVCSKLKRDIPVLLNADVLSTSVTNGSVYVRWSRPLVNTGNLDTLTFVGPYQFILKYRNGRTGNFNPIFTSSSPYFLALDTFFTHGSVNTTDSMAFYQVEFTAMNSATLVGSSQLASSIFLSAQPSDRKITLSWNSNTPWHNTLYTVFRKDPGSSTYSAVVTTTLTTYADTAHIVNRHTYCYKILGNGEYSDPTIYKPLLNNSQEVCATAKDLTPPCSPTVSIDANCPTGFVRVNWNDVRNSCSDDVLKYVLFYKPTLNDAYALVDTFSNDTTSFSLDNLDFIAGCYAVQAVDSSGNASPMSVDFCIDNCPEFELPNIFSPNNDKANDVYKAIKVRQIKEIDLTVFDRWGNLVYKTKDPYFQWDGVSQQSKMLVSDGTFFYFCTVYEPRLTGLRKRELKGYLQVVR